ncbi:SDR family NAD(P)-dependent oxidoreductase [Kribbella sp. NBC_01505]|uniref:SDR family NAD(P)-dependent oxidoreductase n=1 Tax=Kribbella sp. NBC_01505 TaxID=2903580 RepID=UPI00386BF16B
MREAVVTGGTAGFGFYAAVELQRQGYDVTVVGRDAERGAEAVRAIGGGSRFVQADLSSLAEVRALGARLAAEGPLDLLVNNVGGQYPKRWETVDGIEASFALNYLSPVVLTSLLLDSLKEAAPSRIVEVSSSSITTLTGVPTYAGVEEDGEYYGMAATGRAKLAHLAHSLELAGELERTGVSVIVVDPLGPAAAATPNGLAMTPELLPPEFRHLWGQIQDGLRPADAGAPAIVAAATYNWPTGSVLGPDGRPSDDLVKYLTPEISAAVRSLTDRLLG